MASLALSRPAQAIGLHCRTPWQPQPRNTVTAAGAAAAAAHPPATRRQRAPLLRVQARRSDRDDDYVAFDDEEDWEEQGSPISAPGLGPILNTALRGLNAVSGKLTDFALQYAPADASPGVVKVAVNAGLILLALSFVRSLLSFFLTLGTIVLGAYVAVRVFGVDVAGVTGIGGGGIGGSRGAARRSPEGQQPGRQQQRQQRRLDPRSKQSEFKGLLSSLSGEDDGGLLDVRFERRGGSGSGGSGSGSAGKDQGKRRR